jgi:hypothetical protein
MAQDKAYIREWSERLEAGQRDDELLAVAARLESAGQDEQSAPTIEFRRRLRRDLLNQYETAARRPIKLWRFAGSAAAVGLLTVLVITTWLTISSAGRTIPGDVPAIGVQPTPIYIPTAPVDAAVLGPYAVNAPNSLGPGQTLELTAYWYVPDSLGASGAFVRVRDEAGQMIAQADGLLIDLGSETYEVQLAIRLPDSLLDGDREVVFGLHDASGAPLPLYDFANSAVVFEATAPSLTLGPIDTGPNEPAAPTETVIETAITPPVGDSLAVLSVSPTSGSTLTGTQPIAFKIGIDYALNSLSRAILEVRVVELLGEGGGRGVGLATVDLVQGHDTIEVEVMVDPRELLGPRELGLWIQLKADAERETIPIVVEMPEAYRWRYEP